MYSKRLLAGAAALAILTAASAASAATVVLDTTIAEAGTGTTSQFSFAQFDSSLGTLDSVSLFFEAAYTDDSGTLTNNQNGNNAVDYTVTGGASVTVSGNNFTPFTATFGTGQTRVVTFARRTQNTQQSTGAFSGEGDATGTLDTNLSSFVGDGSVTFDFARLSLFKVAPGSATLSIVPQVGGTAQLTYNYTEATAAVPEPATWALMSGGFGGAGAMLRRRRSQVACQA